MHGADHHLAPRELKHDEAREQLRELFAGTVRATLYPEGLRVTLGMAS